MKNFPVLHIVLMKITIASFLRFLGKKKKNQSSNFLLNGFNINLLVDEYVCV